jgi:hypothetical protein
VFTVNFDGKSIKIVPDTQREDTPGAFPLFAEQCLSMQGQASPSTYHTLLPRHASENRYISNWFNLMRAVKKNQV